jgi:hypothetical protein
MSLLRPVIVLAWLWLASGCGSDGSYTVTWAFFMSADSPSVPVFAPGDCGKVGVTAIAITATNGGSQDRPVVACAPGGSTRSLTPGTWTLVLTALDAEGHLKDPPDSGVLPAASNDTQPVMVSVTEGQTTIVEGRVYLQPLPQCRDGVDNDHDGRVDLDDPDCANDRAGSYECPHTASGPCLDTTP